MTAYKSILSIAGLLLAALCAGGAQAQQAQVTPQSLSPPYASYAAKFICGQGDDKDVVLGRYLTAINIHNPQARSPVKFLEKFVLAKPEGVTPRGCIIGHNLQLPPDAAQSVDCDTIISAFSGTTTCFPSGIPPVIEGFVVVQVAAGVDTPSLPLDVVGKYTARGGNGQVSTMDIVVYQPTQITQ